TTSSEDRSNYRGAASDRHDQGKEVNARRPLRSGRPVAAAIRVVEINVRKHSRELPPVASPARLDRTGECRDVRHKEAWRLSFPVLPGARRPRTPGRRGTGLLALAPEQG